ncbi:MAG: hypothetical protein WBV84_14255 [Nitrososphaeraceae archaeon]
MIDYIIGRLASKFNPGDPLTYRSRYKQIDSSFARSDIKAFSFPLDSNISVAHVSLNEIHQVLYHHIAKNTRLTNNNNNNRTVLLSLRPAVELQQSLINLKKWPELSMAMKGLRLC